MLVVLQVLFTAGGSLAVYGFILFVRLLYREYTSTLRNLPGPPSPSWFFGNFKQIQATENAIFYDKWVGEYGPTMRFKFLLNTTRLYTIDPKALSHILHNTHIYEKPELTIWNMNRISGPGGLFTAERDKHKAQRRIMNPAFGPAQLREFTKTFFEKSDELRDTWVSQIEAQGNVARIDAMAWLSRMTLDVIGTTGFNYDFHALKTDSDVNELRQAFSIIFNSAFRITPWMIAQGMIPAFRLLPSAGGAAVRTARRTMDRIGKQLLSESKAFLKATGEKTDTIDTRDLLSLLMRSNMSTDIPENQQMSDEEVIAQVPTFIVAGHESTSTATTWALYALTQHKAVQEKLRQELLSVPTEMPTMEELNSLPYLDLVVRECLRFHAPVPSTSRTAVKDDILPLSIPFNDGNGKECNYVRITKGQLIVIPILAVNLSKALWGEDALEFKPERWEKIPDTVSSIPGVWGSMLTFFGGPHACIGYRFSIVEMKALLFSLVRALEFDLAVPGEEIVARTSIVQRPYVSSHLEVGSQLPLLIKLHSKT